MPGLSIGLGGGRSVGGGGGLGGAAGATIAQTAYGAGSTTPSGGGGWQGHQSAMAVGVASAVFLGFLYWAGGSTERGVFRFNVLMAVPGLAFYGFLGIWARQRLIVGPASGGLHGTAVVVKALTP